jgi:hypothetical protein
MLEDIGNLSLSRPDDANIPVTIFISQIDEKGDPNYGKFRLTAENFMPRRSSVSSEAYEAIADNREEFKDFLNKVRELYVAALTKIDAMINESEDSLYYWRIKD